MIQIELFGKPVPWAAAKVTRRGTYNPKGIEKEAARWQIKAQHRDEPITGDVHLDFTFFVPIPARTSSVKRQQMLHHMIRPRVKPDTTNMQKFYEDCLKGIVIVDDNIVTDVSARKRYSEKPGVLIRVYCLNWEKPEVINQ